MVTTTPEKPKTGKGRKPKVTTVAHMLIDMTGSMAEHKENTIKAVNEYFSSLKGKKGINNFAFTVGLFNSGIGIKYLCERVPLDGVPLLTGDNYQPAGQTPLYDAFGKTIERVAEELKVIKEDPAALIIVDTDGYENASKEYKKEAIKVLIEEKKKQNWQFLFLGCDINAMGEGATIGISVGTTVSYAAPERISTYRTVSESVVAYAATGSQSSENFFNDYTANDVGPPKKKRTKKSDPTWVA